MGTCVETLISAMKAKPWGGAAELGAPAEGGYRDGLVSELGGVPRSALQTVFGNGLGRRIWEDARGAGNGVADEEIVGGMIAYVTRRAGEALQANGREAKAIGLRVEYADGVVILRRMRLARPTADAAELFQAAMELLGRAEARCTAVASMRLNLTSAHAEVASERAGALGFALANAAARA